MLFAFEKLLKSRVSFAVKKSDAIISSLDFFGSASSIPHAERKNSITGRKRNFDIGNSKLVQRAQR
jgi:hypothetical protein